jgi:hypothetical protein
VPYFLNLNQTITTEEPQLDPLVLPPVAQMPGLLP